MEKILKICGKIGGIGGLALGIFLLLCLDLLKVIKIPFLTSEQWYKTIIILIVLTWSLALIGLILTLYIRNLEIKRIKKNIVEGDIEEVKKIKIGDSIPDLNGEKYTEKNIVRGSIKNADEFKLGDGQ